MTDPTRGRSLFPPVNRAADENAIKRKGTAEGITRLARVTSRFYIYIHIYVYTSLDDSHRFITVVSREVSRQDVYTDISFKQETHYLRWPSFFHIYSRIRRGDDAYAHSRF